MSKKIAFFCVTVALSSCGKKEEEAQTENIGVETTDFQSPASNELNIISKDEIADKLSDHYDDFKANSSTTQLDGDECFSLNSQILTAKDDRLYSSGNIDIKSCLDNSAEGSQYTIKASTFQYQFAIRCKDVDMSQFDGKTFADLQSVNEDPCLSAPEQGILMQGVITYHVTAASDSGNGEFKIVTKTHNGSADGDECVATFQNGQYSVSNNCIEVTNTIQEISKVNGASQEDEGKIDFFKISNVGVKNANDSDTLWYLSGSKSVQLNNWTGSVTYTDGTTAPSFQMKNRLSASETLNGTIGVAQGSGLSLFRFGSNVLEGSARKTFNKIEKHLK